jgi:hypothetical protein
MIHEETKDLFVNKAEEELDPELDPTEFDPDLEEPEVPEEGGDDDVEIPDQGMIEGEEEEGEDDDSEEELGGDDAEEEVEEEGGDI